MKVSMENLYVDIGALSIKKTIVVLEGLSKILSRA